jgi:predicted Zn finger-like uncharacterized protein
MSQVLICCPHCGYSKKIAQTKVPAAAKRVKCPHCGEAFALADAIKPWPESQSEGQTAPTPEEAAAPISEPQTESVWREGSKLRPVRFEFNGSGKDYFGIWIVNTLLQIVTLGIYSPWAKVRKRSYFYGCTKFEGINFDYLADPLALLKGWLLGAGLFILYFFGSNFSPILSGIIGILAFVLVPWVVVRSRMFNSRNSAHRNIRFNFYPDYKGAYFAYLWLYLLTPLTLGILAPYMIFRQKQFLVENSSYGKTPFKFLATGKEYYMLCLRGLGIAVLVGVCGFALSAVIGPLFAGMSNSVGAVASLFAFLPLFFIFAYLFVALYFYVRMTNLTWSSIRLGRHHFVCDLKVLEMLWIFFSNGIAIIASVGLLTPWATVRLTRYRLEHLSVTVDGSLEEFEASNRREVNAAGEEIGDIFGMEIGL